MGKTINMDKYNARFATTLREFMQESPKTGGKVTQKELADYLEVRPQTVSLYCTGESLPDCETVMKIADFFEVTADYMITGRKPENKPVRDMLGLSENAVQCLRLVNDGYFEDSPYMLPMEEVRTQVFRYVFVYYNRIRVYTANPGGWPPEIWRRMYFAQAA